MAVGDELLHTKQDSSANDEDESEAVTKIPMLVSLIKTKRNIGFFLWGGGGGGEGFGEFPSSIRSLVRLVRPGK